MLADKNFPNGKLVGLPAVVRRADDLGRLARQARKQQQLTQRDLAGLAGTGPRFMVELEQGKPTVQLQKALDVLALLGLEVVIRPKGGVEGLER
ncbi:type II toxin-antitoxin system Y4mF family antitoxin [Achromobacter aloeverae]|uniref:type II toxin-antitoxin system Y4mF family antitoxin n=1 Tax=Achromobacter aloeverae TaxID=1750518 RepID=UPI001F0027D1|nr:type II toxin-antitoxin system Y4mF family antitoxin [Achromobacter aloeverae]